MNIEKLFVVVIAIPFAMGFINTIINCAAYMLQDAASFFLLIIMCVALLAIARAAFDAVSGIFG